MLGSQATSQGAAIPAASQLSSKRRTGSQPLGQPARQPASVPGMPMMSGGVGVVGVDIGTIAAMLADMGS